MCLFQVQKGRYPSRTITNAHALLRPNGHGLRTTGKYDLMYSGGKPPHLSMTLAFFPNKNAHLPKTWCQARDCRRDLG